jgi:toxin ParE1/3/4
MISARFSPKAGQDLDDIFRYIARDNPDAAQNVCQAILNTADFLAQHPEVGRRIRNASLRHAKTRWSIVPKFRNYLIFYQPYQETIMVIRVLHAAQDWTRYFPPSQNPA